MTDQEALREVAELLAQRVGLTFHDTRRPVLERRLRECASARGLAGIPDLLSALRAEGTRGVVLQDVVDRIVTDETSWYRYPEHFQAMRDFVLPAIASNKSFGSDREIRILSAGCARGHEPYTLAMTVSETPEMEGYRLAVVALDISEAVLRVAREGTYGDADLRGLPTGCLARYFEPLPAGRWRVMEAIRSRVEFIRHNLLEPLRYGTFDVVFCRNVTIYFDRSTTNAVLRNLVGSLRPGGHLFVGHAETHQGVLPELKPVRLAQTVVYRRSRLTSVASEGLA